MVTKNYELPPSDSKSAKMIEIEESEGKDLATALCDRLNSGQSETAICDEWVISRSTLNYWKLRLRIRKETRFFVHTG